MSPDICVGRSARSGSESRPRGTFQDRSVPAAMSVRADDLNERDEDRQHFIEDYLSSYLDGEE